MYIYIFREYLTSFGGKYICRGTGSANNYEFNNVHGVSLTNTMTFLPGNFCQRNLLKLIKT